MTFAPGFTVNRGGGRPAVARANPDPLAQVCEFCKAEIGSPCVRLNGTERSPHDCRLAGARGIKRDVSKPVERVEIGAAR